MSAVLSLFPPSARDLAAEARWSLPLTIDRMDCVAALASMPDACVDGYLTDPAYRSLDRHRAKGTTTRLSVSDASSNAWFETIPNETFGPLLEQMYRVMKPQRYAWIMCDEETSDVVKPYAELAGFYVWRSLTWVKTRLGRGDDERDGEPTEGDTRGGMGYHGQECTERIVLMEKRTRRYAPPAWPAGKVDPPGDGRRMGRIPTALFYPRVLGNGAYATEKPVPLGVRLLEAVTLPGELVVDPFAGSGWAGASALACAEPRRAKLFDIGERSMAHMTERFKGVL